MLYECLKQLFNLYGVILIFRYHEKDQFTRISTLMAINRKRFGRRKSLAKEDIVGNDINQLKEEKEVLRKFLIIAILYSKMYLLSKLQKRKFSIKIRFIMN